MDKSNDEKWAALEAKYPCSEELSFIKHLMYKPVTISSWLPGVFLKNGGEKETGYYGKKLYDVKNHWIMYPVTPEHICFKSCLDENNLSIHMRGELGFGFVSDIKDLHETIVQQFKPSKGLEEGKFFFQSVVSKKDCSQDQGGHVICGMDGEGKNAFLQTSVVPVSEQTEKAFDPNAGLDEQLQKDFPCPDSLAFAKDLMHRPLIVMSEWTRQNLNFRRGEQAKCFTKNFSRTDSQWFMLPLDNGNVLLRSAGFKKHLALKSDTEAHMAEEDSAHAQFKLEKLGEDKFALCNAHTGKYLTTDDKGQLSSANTTAQAKETFLIFNMNLFEDFIAEDNKKYEEQFDSEVKEILGKHWGDFTDFRMVKRDYNIVYAATMASGQKVFMKAKPYLSHSEKEKIAALALKEMVFVDYIAKECGLSSRYEAPGVVTTDRMTLCVVHEAEGQLAMSVPPTQQTDAYFERIGQQLKVFHLASAKFSKEHPEAAESMGAANEVWDGLLKDLTLPELPRTADTYGIMHGDMHPGNFLVDLENDYKMSLFDWDLTCNCWYLVDIATVIHAVRMFSLMDPSISDEAGKAHLKKVTDSMLKGYSPEAPISRDDLRQALKYRVDLIPHVMKWIGDSGVSDVTNSFVDKLNADIEDGKYEFEFL